MRKIFFGAMAMLLIMPGMVFAAQIGAEYKNPLTVNTVDGLVTKFLDAMQLSIVTLAIVFIVIGGILYITSAGDEGRIRTAKGAFTAALIGLAIGIAAPSFIREIYAILGASNSNPVVTQAPRIIDIATNTLQFLLGIAGTLALIAMIIGGIMYLTAGGDESRVDVGKKIFKSAIVGIIIVMASLVVVRAVGGFFTTGATSGTGDATITAPTGGGGGATFPDGNTGGNTGTITPGNGDGCVGGFRDGIPCYEEDPTQ